MFAGIVREETRERVEHVVDVRPAEMPQKRLVVLVDEEDHLPLHVRRRLLAPGLRGGENVRAVAPGEIFDQKTELGGRTFSTERNLEPVRLGNQQIAQFSPERLDRRRLAAAHVEPQHGPRLRPVPLRFDREALEEIAPPLEETLQSGYCQRFSEPTRTRDEELRTERTIRQRQQDTRLVDIDVSALPQTFKGIGVCCNLLHAAYHTITSAPREDMENDAWQRRMRTLLSVIPHAVFSDTRERVRV